MKLKIRTDYLLHFLAGAVVGFISLSIFKTMIAVIIAVVIAGILKEIYDHLSRWLFKKNNTPEWQDMIATWAGGLIPLILMWLFV